MYHFYAVSNYDTSCNSQTPNSLIIIDISAKYQRARIQKCFADGPVEFLMMNNEIFSSIISEIVSVENAMDFSNDNAVVRKVRYQNQ